MGKKENNAAAMLETLLLSMEAKGHNAEAAKIRGMSGAEKLSLALLWEHDILKEEEALKSIAMSIKHFLAQFAEEVGVFEVAHAVLQVTREWMEPIRKAGVPGISEDATDDTIQKVLHDTLLHARFMDTVRGMRHDHRS